jgi:purine-nucleoside phosphorylase
VLIGEGRLHYYEGNSWEAVVRPIQFASEVGARIAILTNASGGIRGDLGPGSLMPIRDHLEWNRPWPWRHRSLPSPYSARFLEMVCTAGEACGLELSPGLYASVTGPNYETPAEVRALRSVGADAVGMSTSREAAAGAECGLECAAISLITNRAAGLSSSTLSHEEVLANARASAEKLGRLIEEFLVRVNLPKSGG